MIQYAIEGIRLGEYMDIPKSLLLEEIPSLIQLIILGKDGQIPSAYMKLFAATIESRISMHVCKEDKSGTALINMKNVASRIFSTFRDHNPPIIISDVLSLEFICLKNDMNPIIAEDYFDLIDSILKLVQNEDD